MAIVRFGVMWCAALALAVAFAGCESSSTTQAQREQPLVICTTQMVGDLISQISGGRLEVQTLMGPDIDPHLFKASPSDVSRLSNADLIVYSGLHLEGNLQPALEALKRTRSVFAVTEDLETQHADQLIKVGEDLYDPHVWHDVKLWKQAGDFALLRLMELFPEHADAFQQNWTAFRERLTELDAFAHREISQLDSKVLVTGHDAFHYFGRAYGLEVLPVQGITTEAEASVKKINELVETLVTRQIPAIFVESTLNDRNLRALVEGAAQRGHAIRLGGPLYSDATGPAGSDAETYEGMIRANLKTIVSGLQPQT